MGFINKRRKKGFASINLNEENVHSIFEGCLATKDTKSTISSTIFSPEYGFVKECQTLLFDKEKLDFQRKKSHI